MGRFVAREQNWYKYLMNSTNHNIGDFSLFFVAHG